MAARGISRVFLAFSAKCDKGPKARREEIPQFARIRECYEVPQHQKKSMYAHGNLGVRSGEAVI
jgi:hypothetical protein